MSKETTKSTKYNPLIYYSEISNRVPANNLPSFSPGAIYLLIYWLTTGKKCNSIQKEFMQCIICINLPFEFSILMKTAQKFVAQFEISEHKGTITELMLKTIDKLTVTEMRRSHAHLQLLKYTHAIPINIKKISKQLITIYKVYWQIETST